MSIRYEVLAAGLNLGNGLRSLTECPQPVEADISPKKADSGFDPDCVKTRNNPLAEHWRGMGPPLLVC
jgi:hypothetical protein